MHMLWRWRQQLLVATALLFCVAFFAERVGGGFLGGAACQPMLRPEAPPPPPPATDCAPAPHPLATNASVGATAAAAFEGTPPSLVLVHVGDKEQFFPAFLPATIRQAVRWNPRVHVYAVVPRAYIASAAGAGLRALGQSGFSESDEYWRAHVTIVELENVTAGDALAKFRADARLNVNEMGGFVRYSTERLFVLGSVMAQFGLDEAFHMEIDNVLYVSLLDLLPALRRLYGGLAATALAYDRMTAGFLYVHRAAALAKMLDFINGAPLPADKQNDMYFLAAFAAHAPEDLGVLPVAPAASSRTYKKGEPDSPLVVGDKDAAAALGGFFDNAAHGQWLGGVHDILTKGIVIPHHENQISVFLAGSLAYKWAVDPRANLRRPYVRLHGENGEDAWRPVYTAHVHSKAIELFAS